MEDLDILKELGLTIVEDFITEEESNEILNHLKLSDTIKGNQRNSVKRYGSKKPYSNCVVSKDIPDFLNKISQKIYDKELLGTIPDSITVNEYRKGQFIVPHIDSHSSGLVVTILSLKCPAIMNFILNERKLSVKLNPKSLIQMRRELRYKWQHSINPVENDRFSLVFRQGS